jgi:hypothetical protein
MKNIGIELKIIPIIPGVNFFVFISFLVSIKIEMLEHNNPKKPDKTANNTAKGIGVIHNTAASIPSEIDT